MDFIPAYIISQQRIQTAKYITTTFAYHSTSYLFNVLNCTQAPVGDSSKIYETIIYRKSLALLIFSERRVKDVKVPPREDL